MIQLPPKKRVPELKLKKLPVIETVPKRTHSPTLSSVTTMVDGIPIIEYICERPSPIYLDSEGSSPTGEQSVSYFSPEPVRNQFFETEVRTDVNVALKKPTRWDSGPRKNFRPEASRKIATDSNFDLKPRDPRVKTFRKHHRQASEQREGGQMDGGRSLQFDENLMDVSSPEYNPPSPFSPLPSSPQSPKVALDTKFPKRRTGFFDSESECSETELSRESSLYRILPTSVGRPPQYMGTGGADQGDERKYFWDSSSGDETGKTENIISMKEVTPDRNVNYSSDDITQTVYKRTETKPLRTSSTSSLRELNTQQRPHRDRIPLLSGTQMIERKEYIPKRHSVCIYCGDKGHASNDTCPLRVCSLCFKIGHNYRECKARGKNRPPKCNRCRISCHEKNRCGEIWRQCHNTTILPNDYPQCAKGNSYIVSMEIQAFRIDQLKSNLYCCNCASFGHVFFQCETPHPSRYFYIPLVGHHDIPLSVPFREIRDNVQKSLLLKSLLPKPYNVVTQNFWGDGNWNDDCDCLDVSGCQANYTTSANREKEIVRHFIESKPDSSPIKSPRLTSSMTELENMSLSHYPLAYDRPNRGVTFYGRDVVGTRAFFNMPHFSYQPDRRQLVPLMYTPEGNSTPVSVGKEEEKRPRERLDIKSVSNREDKRAHVSFSQSINNNKYDKPYKVKQRNLKVREREKRKFDLKEKRVKKQFDARECINRNRTKRQTQQHVRLARNDDVTRTKNSVKRRSPKRSIKKDGKSVGGNSDQPTNEETYMFVDEAN